MDLSAFINASLWILLVFIVGYAIFYFIDRVGAPNPPAMIAKGVTALILAFVLIGFLTGNVRLPGIIH